VLLLLLLIIMMMVNKMNKQIKMTGGNKTKILLDLEGVDLLMTGEEGIKIGETRMRNRIHAAVAAQLISFLLAR